MNDTLLPDIQMSTKKPRTTQMNENNEMRFAFVNFSWKKSSNDISHFTEGIQLLFFSYVVLGCTLSFCLFGMYLVYV